MAKFRGLIGFVAVAMPILPIRAAETATYTYDAKGRLVKAVHLGDIKGGVTAEYGHDKADNRTTVKVSGAS